MGIKVYYSEISAHKEVKKRQQKVMMILDSKTIPYEAIDITEPGKESDKEFMLANAKPKGDSKYVLSPQVFNGDTYCGDYEDFELANENDELEKFLNIAKIENGMKKVNQNQNQNGAVNGNSREGSTEKQAEPAAVAPPPPEPEPTPEPEPVAKEEVEEPTAEVPQEVSQPEVEGGDEEEPMSTTEPAPQPPPPAETEEEGLDSVQPEFTAENEDEEDQ